LSESFAERLGNLSKDFRNIIEIPAGASPALALRLAISDPASVRSRRSLDRVRLLDG
jgi:hypothetical protein